MPKQNRMPPALKHGFYQQLGILPTEDRAAFEEFRRQIEAELRITGPAEGAIVSNLASRLWRMQNLQTYSLAEHVRTRLQEIYSQLFPSVEFPSLCKDTRTPEELAALRKEVDKKVNIELNRFPQEIVDARDTVTIDNLDKELDIAERIDSAISRSLKQLLMLRGVKSLLPTVPQNSTEQKS